MIDLVLYKHRKLQLEPIKKAKVDKQKQDHPNYNSKPNLVPWFSSCSHATSSLFTSSTLKTSIIAWPRGKMIFLILYRLDYPIRLYHSN